MENEVVIHVKAHNDTHIGFAAAEHDAHVAGERSGDTFRTGMSGKVFRALSGLGEKLTSVLASASGKLPGFLGKAISGMPPQGQALALVLVAGLVATLAPMLGAAITAAVLLAVGGGVLVAGIMAAASDPKVKAAFGEFGKRAKEAFAGFGDPFKAPLIRAAQTFSEALKVIGPKIKELGVIIAPVIDKLAPALAKFIENAMPGIKDAVKAAVPLFNTLADKLPALGTAMSDFFTTISKHGDDANLFFSDLLDFLIGLIKVLGHVIAWLADFYSAWRNGVKIAANAVAGFGRTVINIFGNILDAAATALSWVPGLGPKLRAASDKFKQFRDRANGYLAGIATAVNIAVQFNVVGLAAARTAISTARILAGMGYAHGGIVGAATGGLHSGMRLVGEHGPELLDLPPGTNVHSNPDTQRMTSGGGGGTMSLTLKAAATASHDLMDVIIEGLRGEIRGQGGNVQQVLGVAGR